MDKSREDTTSHSEMSAKLAETANTESISSTAQDVIDTPTLCHSAVATEVPPVGSCSPGMSSSSDTRGPAGGGIATASVGDEACAAVTSPATPTGSHGADPVLLSQLLEMGIPFNLAVRSLLVSGNSSVEAAVTWLADLSPTEADALAVKPVEDDAADWEDLDDDGAAADAGPKMVLVVDGSLGMRPGKMAAQVGHAVLGLYRQLRRINATGLRARLTEWEMVGEKMVVVKATGGAQLKELRQKAELKKLHTYTVCDAGLTQIVRGSQTVMAVFGAAQAVDEVTGDLKLM